MDKHSNYAGVVSCKSVHITLTYASLNNLDVVAADVQNAYLQAPTSKKHFIICTDEFVLGYEGCVAIIACALYGRKSAGRNDWLHMRLLMNHIGFKSSHGDPDVWMKEGINEDGSQQQSVPYCMWVINFV